ncbi:TlpA family protein disulfide reductase [Corynebacterium pseudotuberculosis]|uniref:TlpA family protein disulfide reductase n=1 Tax=Corynebacterium pseudotuberculosis TaxID=1719 RepID=UPI00030F510F|nr:TlpA disulfide reductase family protein [Corynebacterium pseudotuberculosis]AFM08137.2 redoxin domain-containing protein [Corynebacterium pseudotuberculosis Cp162]APG82545.1 Thiol-disulfide oxidoreductase [Corynebacterium pseudotuberculosis]WFP66962.1 TlpA disulfide reductase family protein [Corynebacterium pseudotuberculosis]
MTNKKRVIILLAAIVVVLGAIYMVQKPQEDTVTVDNTSGKTIRLGEEAPNFKALDIKGHPFDLAALKGKPIWIVFNATWCSNCRAEIPEIQELAKEDSIAVVSIYLNEKSTQVRQYAEKLGLTYTQIPDARGTISASYGVSAVPSHVVIDEHFKVKWIKAGTITGQDIKKALEG